jgi:peptidoglycan/LPS O-acetylase OafA/YrhL
MRVRELDLLRFVAAMGVVLYHYTYHYTGARSNASLYPELEGVTAHGYLGVNLFFMISGFVILWTARAKPPAAFVISRITRLYPEFWLGVILSASTFAVFPIGSRPDLTLPTVLANLTMVPQLLGYAYVDGVYWTLGVELKFYALLWLLSITGQMRRIEAWVFGWLAVETYCFAFGGPHVARSLALHPFGPYFIAGCLFFLVRSERLTVARGVGLFVCVVLSVVESIDDMGGFLESADITASARVSTAAVIVSFFVAFLLIAVRSKEVGLAGRLAFLGALTYPLYLTHNIAKAALLSLGDGLHPYLRLVIAVSFSLALSSLMVLVIERRMRKPCTEFLTRCYQRLAVPRGS